MNAKPDNSMAGVHRYKSDGGNRIEAFEVFYREDHAPGWYWRPLPAVHGGHIVSTEDVGPFSSARAAFDDARTQC